MISPLPNFLFALFSAVSFKKDVFSCSQIYRKLHAKVLGDYIAVKKWKHSQVAGVAASDRTVARQNNRAALKALCV